MRCKHCGGGEVTVVDFQCGDGATFSYCRDCESAAWESSGEQVGRKDILKVASKIEPARRRVA